MTPDPKTSAHVAIERVAGTATRIRQLEAEAARLLQNGDTDGYRERYVAKTRLLTELPGAVEDVLPQLDDHLAERLHDGLEDMARRAGQALALNSPFYMYALLYPDDYQPGAPNELETFVDELRQLAS